MIEKVNPKHPDKIADRIAGAIVDLAYKTEKEPKIAIEVLIGHGRCHIIIETSTNLNKYEIDETVCRIAGNVEVDCQIVQQDEELAKNQKEKIRCGDNGIFRGAPLTEEEKKLSRIARDLYYKYDSDGKYILDKDKLIICQSNAKNEDIRAQYPNAIINPLGEWTGGINVDTGATNRKIGSDNGHSITGGGLHGKDLSKADVSITIYAFLKAQETGKEVEISCAIGDDTIDGKPYEEIVSVAKDFINNIGGFEKLAEWGLY